MKCETCDIELTFIEITVGQNHIHLFVCESCNEIKVNEFKLTKLEIEKGHRFPENYFKFDGNHVYLEKRSVI